MDSAYDGTQMKTKLDSGAALQPIGALDPDDPTWLSSPTSPSHAFPDDLAGVVTPALPEPGHATPDELGAEVPELPRPDPLPPAVPPSPPDPEREPWELPEPEPEPWPSPVPEPTPWPEPEPTTPAAVNTSPARIDVRQVVGS